MVFSGCWEIDNLIMTDILDGIEFYSCSRRKNMLRKGKFKFSKYDQGSMLYGLTWRGYLKPGVYRQRCPKTSMFMTKIMGQHPELDEIFREFADFHFPDFDYGSVQMNKNFPCPRHIDGSNKSKSILCCFGDYTGGETCVEYPAGIKELFPQKKPVCFDGSKYYHWTKPFEGKRYSLVFFHSPLSLL